LGHAGSLGELTDREFINVFAKQNRQQPQLLI
jgi:hypothetical protein